MYTGVLKVQIYPIAAHYQACYQHELPYIIAGYKQTFSNQFIIHFCEYKCYK